MMRSGQKTKKNIFFLVATLKWGGAERVLSIILKFLDRSQFNITVVLIKNEEGAIYALPDDVIIIRLNKDRVRHALLDIGKLLRKHQPDLVFSTLGSFNVLLGLIRFFLPSGIKFVVRETSVPSVYNNYSKGTSVYNFLYRFVYRRFERIICQSRYMRDDLVAQYGVPAEKIVVINNPVDVTLIDQVLETAKPEVPLPGKLHLLAVGRFSYEKGYDLLIKSLGLIRNENVFLTIIGDGALKTEVEALIREEGLEHMVRLMGQRPNPFVYMRQADMMVLSSRVEGFPNVVIESMVCGTPVVAFDSPGGTGEIIDDTQNGLLVKTGDVEELARKIMQAANISWDRAAIREEAVSKYHSALLVKRYEETFMSV